MKRGAAQKYSQTAAFFIVAVLAFAAVSRDAYREAYRAWREADPTLERDVATAPPAIAADIDRVGNAAAKFTSARADYLNQTAAAENQILAGLIEERAYPPPPVSAAAQIVAAETNAVHHSLDTYGTDPDPAIQEVRVMLDKENLALVSLASVIADGQKAADQVHSAAADEQAARARAAAQAQDSAASIKTQIADANQEATAWAEYYRRLSDAARGTGPASVSSAAPPSASPVQPAPELRPLTPSITPVPLARYTGAWVYPTVNGLAHGPQPELVDLVVNEENGHADGTLFARFKVTSGDPVIRFDFSGDFKKTRNQVFNLVTSDHATGTIELIPGPAFNLLEINFQIEPRPGKISQANFLLVKK